MKLAGPAWKALGAAILGLAAFGAFAQPVWQTFQTAVGSSGNAVVNKPAGTVAGDILVVGLMVEKGSGETITATGWNLIRRTDQSTNVGMATYWKLAGGAEPATYSFTLANGSKWAIGISRITGADTASPIDVHQGTTGTSGTSVRAPSVTTTGINRLVLAFYTNKKNSTYTAAGTTNERYDVPNGAGGLPSNMMATFVQAAAGATGNRDATATDSESWVGQQVAIRWLNTAPPAPTLVSPADGATVITSTPTFDWSDVTDPEGHTVTYEVQADDSGCSFPSPEINQTALATSTYTPGASLADATYCWRARAVDQYGAAGPWSTTRNLTVDAVITGSQTRDPGSSADCNALALPDANWNNPGNAASSDDSYATSSVDGTVTDPLYCLNYSFSIPSNATILGIEVLVERRSSSTANGGSRDNYLYLVKGGAAAGNNGATATTYTTIDVIEPHGSASDLWGTTWTPADINAANFGAGFSATKPNSSGAAHTVSVDLMRITVHYSIPNVATPGSFNAFETSTPANAISGQVYTKRASVNFALDVVAISSGAQLGSFTNTVEVDLVTGSTGGANCPGTPVAVTGTTQTVNLTGGRGTTGTFSVASASSDVRVRIRYPVSSPTVTSCSTDNFAIRPSGITVTSSNATNSSTSGTPTIKTGATFNLTAATGVAGYNGVPSIDNGQIVGSPNAGAIGGSFGAANPASGTASGSSFFYSEVGNFGLNANAVRDTTFTAVDQPNDCTADFSNSLVGGKYGCYFGSSAVAMTPGSSGFGRFIPDNFNVTYNAPSFTTYCSGGSGFTYLGQALPYSVAPQITITARSGTANGLTNTTTTNYAGAYMKLANSSASLNQAPFNSQAGRYSRFDALGGGSTPALDFALLPATTADPTIGTFTNGVGVLTFASGLAFVRSTSSLSAAFDADVSLALNIVDADGVLFAGNPARFGQASAGNGMTFTGGKSMRYGRLRLENAVGSEKMDLPIPIQVQYWTGTTFQTNGADNCTTISAANAGFSSYFGGITATNMNSANVSGLGAAFSAGFGSLTLTKPTPTPASAGAVTLTIDLAAEGKSYLQGNWGVSTYTANPSARAAFGLYSVQPNNFIYFRENY